MQADPCLNCQLRANGLLRASVACSGEGNQQNVDDMLAAALEYYGERGMLDDTPVPMTLERERRGSATASSPLRYPGKLTADLAGGRLFISDSNNHRHAAHATALLHSTPHPVC